MRGRREMVRGNEGRRMGKRWLKKMGRGRLGKGEWEGEERVPKDRGKERNSRGYRRSGSRRRKEIRKEGGGGN